MTDTTPRIYVADLAAYNAGTLHGTWLDATDDIESIQGQVRELLAASPEPFAEEYAIHDFEGFDGFELTEYTCLARVHEIACFIDEHPDLAGPVLAHFGGDLDDARAAIEEDYAGEYASTSDFVAELTEQTSDVPEHLAPYIDYDAMGRDLALNGDIVTVETGFEQVHIFWNR